jgi:hypothetical protein
MITVGSGNGIQFKVTADRLPIHVSDPRRRPWVEKPRHGIRLEELVTRVVEQKARNKEVRNGR